MKRIAIAVLLATACVLASAKAKSGSGIRPVLIYSMDNCPACEALAGALADAGTRIRVGYTQSVSVDSFPTVVYSDGKRDSGSRIRSGAAKIPGSVRIVKWSGQ